MGFYSSQEMSLVDPKILSSMIREGSTPELR